MVCGNVHVRSGRCVYRLVAVIKLQVCQRSHTRNGCQHGTTYDIARHVEASQCRRQLLRLTSELANDARAPDAEVDQTREACNGAHERLRLRNQVRIVRAREIEACEEQKRRERTLQRRDGAWSSPSGVCAQVKYLR